MEKLRWTSALVFMVLCIAGLLFLGSLNKSGPTRLRDENFDAKRIIMHDATDFDVFVSRVGDTPAMSRPTKFNHLSDVLIKEDLKSHEQVWVHYREAPVEDGAVRKSFEIHVHVQSEVEIAGVGTQPPLQP